MTVYIVVVVRTQGIDVLDTAWENICTARHVADTLAVEPDVIRVEVRPLDVERIF